MTDRDHQTTDGYRTAHVLPTPHQREIVTILIEECAELTKALTKLLRFGADDGYPGSPITNRIEASNEAGDVVEMIDQAIRVGILDVGQVDVGRIVKREKLSRYLQTQPEGLGKLSDPRSDTILAEQTEQLARDIWTAQRGDWPADIAEARRMVRLAAPLSEAQEMAVAERLLALCRQAEQDAKAHDVAAVRDAWRS